MKSLIIIGAGGHGRVIADIAQKSKKYKKIGFLDDNALGECLGFPILGKVFEMKNFIGKADLFVAIGNNLARQKLIEELLELGASVPTLIHPSAIIGSGVCIDKGTAVMAGAIINPCAKIGKGVIINTCSSVDHDCVVHDYAHIAVGVNVAGTVVLGERAWIGAGATIKNNVSISCDAIIGAGAVVVDNIETAGTYVGVPAKKIKD